MPRKPTPAGKQRVRTGCLTCRKRRRKCDEQKPRCANCEVKGFVCKYKSDLAFVPPKSGQTGGSGQAYGAITFVDDSPLVSAGRKSIVHPQSNTPVPPDTLNAPDTPPPSSTRDSRRAVEVQDLLISNAPSVYSPEPPILQSAPSLLLNGSGATPENNYLNRPSYRAFPNLISSDQTSTRRLTTATASQETDLLRHFRYCVAPWIDVGDPDCALGIKTLLLCRTNWPLQAAVLALAAGHRSFLSLCPDTKDLDNSSKFRDKAERALPSEPELARGIGQALLMLQELLPCGPQSWRALLSHQMDMISGVPSVSMSEELSEALFWLYFRIDLAASIVTSQAPLIPFGSFLQRDGSFIQSSRIPTQSQSVNCIYKKSLCLLGHCLALIHGDPEVPSPQTTTASPELAAYPSLRQSHFLSQWTILWTECQKWYNDRPVDGQQIVDIRGGEADTIDPEHDSSFPILIFTTPMALVANVVYHITSLLLLTHKPRLLKSLPGPRCFTSHIWHAQAIAGIAASNDTPEQWDPIFVAGLLAIAREMTHESQQAVVLDSLRRVTAMTGMKLDGETQELRDTWNVARCDDEEEGGEEGNEDSILS